LVKYCYSEEIAAVEATIKSRTGRLSTVTDLEPFLDQKKGGGIHVYEKEAWDCIKEWQRAGEEMSTKPGKSPKEKALQDFIERDATSRMAKYWKGDTDMGPEYVSKLLDRGLDLRSRLKAAASLRTSALNAGVANRSWNLGPNTQHAIAIVYDQNGIGTIFNPSKPQACDILNTVPCSDEFTRLRKNIQGFYGHVVFVQNVFEVDVEFDEARVSEMVSSKLQQYKVAADSAVVVATVNESSVVRRRKRSKK
jgi:hypothetical protein